MPRRRPESRASAGYWTDRLEFARLGQARASGAQSLRRWREPQGQRTGVRLGQRPLGWPG